GRRPRAEPAGAKRPRGSAEEFGPVPDPPPGQPRRGPDARRRRVPLTPPGRGGVGGLRAGQGAAPLGGRRPRPRGALGPAAVAGPGGAGLDRPGRPRRRPGGAGRGGAAPGGAGAPRRGDGAGGSLPGDRGGDGESAGGGGATARAGPRGSGGAGGPA